MLPIEMPDIIQQRFNATAAVKSIQMEKERFASSDKSRMEYVLRGNGSVLDDLKEEAKSVHRQISRRDQQKLDEYLSSLRQVEKILQKLQLQQTQQEILHVQQLQLHLL